MALSGSPPPLLQDRIFRVTTRRSGTLATTLHPLTTPDGVRISVSRLPNPGARDVCLLIHGLTTSSDMYVMPEHYGLAAFLHDQGYDVWLADFRMSNHYAYNTDATFTFDEIGAYDWPTIIDFIRRTVGSDARLHVICHCLGSVTFHHALYGKSVSGITSVVSNSVSLNPRVHPFAMMKLVAAPFLVDSVLRMRVVDPRWGQPGVKAPLVGRALAKLVNLVHLECNDPACNLVSFLWGSGFPAVFTHEKMAPETHDRLTELFGPVAMSYFRNVRHGVFNGNCFGRYSTKPEFAKLPDRYIDRVGEVVVPTLLLSGDKNHIFPGANALTAALIARKGLSGYEYRELPGYGHQDVLMGKDCDREVFPLIHQFIRAQALAGVSRP